MSVLETVECPQLSSIKIDMEAYQHITGLDLDKSG